MAMNTVQNSSNLYPEDVIVFVAPYASSNTTLASISSTGSTVTWTNVGAISEYSRESANASVQPAAFNVEHAQVITKEAETLNVTLQEMNPVVISLLRGGVNQSASTYLPIGSSSSTALVDVIYSGGADTLTPFMVWEYAKFSDGRSRYTYFPYVHYVSGGSLNPKAQGTGEFATMPFTMEARESPSLKYGNRGLYRIEMFSTAST